MLRPWQAYQKLFYGELKAKVESEWQEFQKANPESMMTLFEFRNEKARIWYEESSPEVKEQVEEYRKKLKDGSANSADVKESDRQNRSFQE